MEPTLNMKQTGGPRTSQSEQNVQKVSASKFIDTQTFGSIKNITNIIMACFEVIFEIISIKDSVSAETKAE